MPAPTDSTPSSTPYMDMTERMLEHHLRIDTSDLAPVVVHDHMVLAWRIFRYIGENWHAPRTGTNYESFVRAVWALVINRGPDCMPMWNARHIVVADQKRNGNYWRDEAISEDPRMTKVWDNFLEAKVARKRAVNFDPESQDRSYKGGRGEKPEDWVLIERIGWEYATQFFPTFRSEGYEADDFMGAVYRASRRKTSVSGKRHVFYHTIDRDITQLVDESANLYWANTRYNLPNEAIQGRLVGDLEVVQHTFHKTGEVIKGPQGLVAAKVIVGDMGDNLPPNTPYEYFDLRKPHKIHNVDKLPQIKTLRKQLNTSCANTRTEHFLEAQQVLNKAGLKMPYYI